MRLLQKLHKLSENKKFKRFTKVGILKSLKILRRFICLFYLSPLLSSFASFANYQGVVSYEQKQLQSIPPGQLQSLLPEQLQIGIELQTMQYFTQIKNSPQNSSAQLVELDFKYQTDNVVNKNLINEDLVSKDLATNRFVSDVSLYSYLESGSSQLNIRELFYSIGDHSTFGRKINNWSLGDQYWNTNYFEPQFAHDPLRPETQGLIGYFFQSDTGEWQHTFLLSPLFVPSLGPEVQEVGGRLVSKSRWARSAPESFKFNDYDGAIVYDLDVPDYLKIANHAGVVLGTKYTNNAFQTNLSMAHKPNNKLNLKYQQLLNSPEDQDIYATATVEPKVSYHSVFGTEFIFTKEKSQLVLSLVADIPQDDSVENNYIEQKYVPSQMLSAVINSNFALLKQEYQISLGVLKVNGAQIEDRDSQNQKIESIQSTRFDFTQATSLQLRSRKYFKKFETRFLFKWLYDTAQLGSVTQFETTFLTKNKLAFVLGADVLAVRSESNPKDELGFINQYRSNDRVYTGLSYVF